MCVCHFPFLIDPWPHIVVGCPEKFEPRAARHQWAPIYGRFMALTLDFSSPPPPSPFLASLLPLPLLPLPLLFSHLCTSSNRSITKSSTSLHCPTCSSSSSSISGGALQVMALPSSSLRRRGASGNQVVRGGGGRSVVAISLIERITDPNSLVSPPPLSIP